MLERDWRQLYIHGATPERAAEEAATVYRNSWPLLERTKR
jgi:hypothetical protein